MPVLPIDAGRYGSEEMKRIFEEQSRLDYLLEFEAVVAESQGKVRIIPLSAAKEIAGKARSGRILVKRVKELEARSEHDTAAMVESISELCDERARPWVHYGLTSYDAVDTTISMQMRDSLLIIERKIIKLAIMLADKAARYKDVPAVGRTHGQHASIIAFGLKFAVWASDLVNHIIRIREMKRRVLICKTLGVVGTGSLMGNKAVEVQELVSKKLNLYPVDAATQIVSRERHAEYVFSMALVAATVDKIAVEIRNLQRTEIGEVSEPFRKGQMGSSAVPIKKNPIKSERVSSLARILKSMVAISLDNIALWHERDLSNSANERFTIPMAAILLDEMLDSTVFVLSGLKVYERRITANLEHTKGQIYAEFVLDALIKKGMARFDAYRTVQRVAFSASEKNMHFLDALNADREVSSALSYSELKAIFNPKKHLASSTKIINNVGRTVRKIKVTS
jgi:adenylosuccinate lyase